MEATDQEGATDAKVEAANTVSESIQADIEAVGKKRSREDDGTEVEREAKKVDVKT